MDTISSLALCASDVYQDDDPAEFLKYVDKIESKNVRAMTYLYKGSQVIAFRGTRKWSMSDLITNMSVFPVYCNVMQTYVHVGFLKYTKSICPELVQKIDVSSGTIFVCGHSMGGSIALLFSYYLMSLYPDLNVTLCTFGQPRTLFKSPPKRARLTYYRISHDNDPITYIPPFYTGYIHTENHLRLNLGTSTNQSCYLWLTSILQNRHCMKSYIDIICKEL